MEVDVEQRQKQEVVIRKLMRRKSKRETKAIWSEIRNGVLRRTNSVEDVSEELETGKTEVAAVQTKVSPRVRHNSDGHYDDVKIINQKAEDNVYENVTFFQGSAKFGQTTKTGVKTKEDWERLNTVANNGTQPGHLEKRQGARCQQYILTSCNSRRALTCPDDYEHISSLTTKQSDSGSVGSHNDSGYGTRLGQSSSSPELTHSDSEPHQPYYSQVTQYNPYIYTHTHVVISPSSLV